MPNRAEISVKGRTIEVASVGIGETTIVASGRWLRVAEVLDEEWQPGEVVTDPDACIAKIRQENLEADLFTFAQKLPNTGPMYDYPMEWQSTAAIPTGNFSFWWNQRLPQETRKNVRRATRCGVTIREIQFNDALVRDIVDINNNAPVRQGRNFWHYGKSFAQVKADYASYADRSAYIGAFYEAELIGFIKMVFMGETAGILQLLCKQSHYDKRAANALLARAVELCCAKGMRYLTYGRYVYGRNRHSPLTEFKRRNGFEEVLLPRYYVPLTGKGRLAVRLGLHHGLRTLLPGPVFALAVTLRAAWYHRLWRGRRAGV